MCLVLACWAACAVPSICCGNVVAKASIWPAHQGQRIPPIYAMICKADTTGVFQIESQRADGDVTLAEAADLLLSGHRGAIMLACRGRVQREGHVIHMVVEQLE